jgi:hypothetical protein
MPLFLEPDQRFSVSLECDRDKPAETRPTFFAKSQTMRNQRKVGEVLDSIYADPAPDIDEMFTAACDMLATVLVGWKNMGGIEYSREALEDVLTFTEARELLRLVMFNQGLTDDQKKATE